MAHIRTIKPEFFMDDKLAEVSIWARFIFPGLWTLADIAGRLVARPKRLKAALLPYDDQDIETILQELHEGGFIVRYVVDGENYIFIPNFRKHQRITGREAEAESQLPSHLSPEIEPEITTETIGKQSGNTEEAPRTTGKEGNGKEGKGSVRGDAPRSTPTKFVKPTEPEATEYAVELGLPPSEGPKFLNYHESKGWLVGRVPMKDWKAALRTWKGNYGKFNDDPPTGTAARGPTSPPSPPKRTAEEIKRLTA